MPSHPPIPPLLCQYISDFRSGSLALLTSTLGTTTNWLLLRYIHAALNGMGDGGPSVAPDNTRVILVSWLRDAGFWREAGRKLGVALPKVQIVDALSNGLGLGAGGIAELENEVSRAIAGAREAMKEEGSVLLALDGLDFLLAATACPIDNAMDMIGEFRELVDSIIITSCADLALMQPSSTPLGITHAAFLMSTAHQAQLIVGLRGLDTGVAKDISGVLRISRGAAADFEREQADDKECLYFLEADGGVKVFERGA